MADAFLDIFMRELRERVKGGMGIADPVDGRVLSDIRRLCPLREARRTGTGKTGKVVAVDGGIGTLKLRSGHDILIARAAAVSPLYGSPIRELLIDVALTEGTTVKGVYLGIVEAMAALRALDGGEGIDVLLVDGSLYTRILRALHGLVLSRDFHLLYLAPELSLLLYLTYKLLEKAHRGGVRTLFVSKDTRMRALKELLLFTVLSERLDDEVVDVGRRYYSVLWIRKYRRRLFELLASSLESGRTYMSSLLGLVLNHSVTDPTLVSHMASGRTVYTPPLFVGGVDAYVKYRGLSSPTSLLRAVRARIEDAALLRRYDDGAVDSLLELVGRAIRGIPAVYMWYLVPRGDSPLMVEQPAFGTPMFGTERLELRVEMDMAEEAEMLMAHYKGPTHYNAWLWLAHRYAALSRADLMEYAAYIGAATGTSVYGRRLKMFLS